MQLKLKAKNRCIFCKKKIKVGEEIGIYKTGVVIHAKSCKQELDRIIKEDEGKNV